MEIVSCGKGHFYDKSKGECPQCAAERAAAGGIGGGMDYGKTMPSMDIGATMPATGGFNESNVFAGDMDSIPPTAPVSSSGVNVGAAGETIPVSKPDFRTSDFNASMRGVPTVNQVDDYPETRPVGFNEMSYFDPIVGWLVCVDGPNKGQDYRLHAGNNRVGRNPQNDVYLQGDLTVSGEDNCVIGYDNRSGRFFFAAGTGKNMVYVNNEVVFNHVELHAYDIITVGSTNLMFVPLCGEHFSWNQ